MGLGTRPLFQNMALKGGRELGMSVELKVQQDIVYPRSNKEQKGLRLIKAVAGTEHHGRPVLQV